MGVHDHALRNFMPVLSWPGRSFKGRFIFRISETSWFTDWRFPKSEPLFDLEQSQISHYLFETRSTVSAEVTTIVFQFSKWGLVSSWALKTPPFKKIHSNPFFQNYIEVVIDCTGKWIIINDFFYKKWLKGWFKHWLFGSKNE